jgi:hypothetical protein
MQLSNVHPDCHNFVIVVEELLRRRQQEIYDEPRYQKWYHDDWGPRTWTRTEMEDMVYSSYKQMRQGRITRPPRREVVMDIADYLNCTIEERNRLLLSANIAPIDPYLTGEALEERLQPTIEIAEALAMPATVINRDWRIHFLNYQMTALYDLTPEQIEAVPPENRNVLRLLFDPQLPLYANLIDNSASWTRMVRQTIYGFKMTNRLCQFEAWYQELVEQLMELPDFEYHWKTVRTDASFDQDPSAKNLPSTVMLDSAIPRLRVHSRRSWLRPLVISTGYFQFDFPQIIAFLPANEDLRSLFAEIGTVQPADF